MGMVGNRAGTGICQSRAKAAFGALMGLGKMPHYNVNLLKSRRFRVSETLRRMRIAPFPQRGGCIAQIMASTSGGGEQQPPLIFVVRL
jgi:hypothetical protein